MRLGPGPWQRPALVGRPDEVGHLGLLPLVGHQEPGLCRQGEPLLRGLY